MAPYNRTKRDTPMPLTVRYIGPGEAILAGAYIQQGETRSVTPGQLQAALADHPAGFEIVAGDDAPLLPEPLQQPAQLNEPVDLVDRAEDLSEPAPAAPRRRRHHGAA